MRIKKMYATFGKLDRDELELKDGLNIICGDNESGKSTWSAFIRAMLYGISTREKARIGFMPDKEKYLPWSGSPMYGRMELQSGGKAITLERTATKGGVLGTAKSTYDTTGTPAEVADELVGAAREVYERTAFISQSQIRVDHDGEIERRILSIAGSGDEDVSFGEVKARLQAKKRTIRTVRDGGELSLIEAQIDEICDMLKTADDTDEALRAANARLSGVSEDMSSVERKIAIKKAVQNSERDAFIKKATDELTLARAEADKYRDAPTREVLESLSSLMRESVKAKSELSNLSLLSASSENEIAALREKIDRHSIFGGLSANDAEARADADIELVLAPNANKKRAFAPSIFVLVSILSAIAAFLTNSIFRLAFFAVAAIFIAIFAFSFFKLKTKGKKTEIIRLAELYGNASEDRILAHLGDYLTLLSDFNDAEERATANLSLLEAAKINNDKLSKEMRDLLLGAGLSGLSADEGELRLTELVHAREAALRAEADAKIRVDAILEASVDVSDLNVEYKPEEIPAESLEDLQKNYDELSAQLRECELSIAALAPRKASIDRSECEQKLAALHARHAELSLTYEALDMALEELALADGELRRRFAPEVSRRASEIFFELTGGSFEIVRILNSDFDMDVSEVSASAPRDILQLSRGTLDELYLSLRLALCELVLDGEKTPPMILDDVFVNFDGTRLARALNLLHRLSEKRQIILFTCHEREARYFEDITDVRIIRLSPEATV